MEIKYIQGIPAAMDSSSSSSSNEDEDARLRDEVIIITINSYTY